MKSLPGSRINILIPAFIVLMSLLFIDIYIYATAALLAVIIFMLNRSQETLIFLILLLLMTLVGEINPSLRIAVQLFSYGSLILMFIKEYGFEFNKYPQPPRPVTVFVVLLLSVMFLSSLFSGYPLIGFREILKTSIVFFLIYLLFTVLNTDVRIKAAFFALLIASITMAVSTLYSFISSDFNLMTLFAITNIRMSGLLSNFNALSVYFAVAIPLLFSLLFIYQRRTYRLIIGAIICLLIFGLILTGSRASLTSLIVTLLFIAVILKPQMLKISLIFVGIIYLSYLLLPEVNESLSLLLRLDEGLSHRDQLWQMSIEMIKDNLLLGIGPGTWGIKMYQYFPVMLESYLGYSLIHLSEITAGVSNSHSFYLTLFSDLGIFGFLLSLAFPLIFFNIAKETINKYKRSSRENYILSIVLTGIGLGMFVRAFFESINVISFGWITADLPFWLNFIFLMYIRKQPIQLWSGMREIQ